MVDHMKWNIVPDCDNDNGEPKQWACKSTKDSQFVWIDKIGERDSIENISQLQKQL